MTTSVQAWCVRISAFDLTSSVIRLWNGAGELTYDGQTWLGTRGTYGTPIAIGRMESSIAQLDDRLEIVIAVTTDASKGYFRLDRGPSVVRVEWLTTDPTEHRYVSTGRVVEGRMSGGEYDVEDGVFRAEVLTAADLIDRRSPVRWNHEYWFKTQGQKTPPVVDKGFIYAADLEGSEIRWP